MRHYIHSLGILLLVCTLFQHSFAQDDQQPQRYYQIDYMKVPPGGDDNYLALEAVWKKIHQKNIDMGRYQSWHLSTVRFPVGTEVEYNYRTRITFDGEKQMADFMANGIFPDVEPESFLTKDDIEMVMNTSNYRDLVKSEVWFHIDGILPENMETPSVMVFNYFKNPQWGDRREHVRVEREVWKPYHQARVDADMMEGWVLVGMGTPGGSSMPYNDATVDIYKSWDQYLNVSGKEAPSWDSVHPGINVEEVWSQTMEASNLVRQEVHIPLDVVRKK